MGNSMFGKGVKQCCLRGRLVDEGTMGEGFCATNTTASLWASAHLGAC